MPFLQPDGTTIHILKCGDEHFHWITDTDGRLLIEHEDGFLRPATEADSLQVVAQGQRAAQRRATFAPSTTFPTIGEPRSLIVLAEFPDRTFLSETAHDDFEAMLNEEGYSALGGTGSARDYYIAASCGQFQPHFDVAGPVMLSKSYAYYGKNGYNGDDAHATDMIIEACELVDEFTDFSQYDTDGDGRIDNVFVFYAGYGEATSYDANTVWPHSWEISSYSYSPVIFDGVRLDHYACSNERSPSDLMDGIGTFVHEFAHVLGLPDLYSTSYTNAWTPGEFSVLDQGNYNNNSRTPAGFSAYERKCMGWLSPCTLSDSAHIILPELKEANTAALIETDNPNECFILENRQRTGWDKYIPGHGMLIWHIDYDPYIWMMNRVNNNGSHQYVDIIEADDIRSNGTRSADPFPGTQSISEFTATTKPAFKSWSGQAMPPLTGITEIDGVISFDFNGGGPELPLVQLDSPKALEADSLTDTGFVARWAEVPTADAYILSVMQQYDEPDSVVIDFSDYSKSGLPEGWSTTAASTYANANYSGKAIPSLRFTGDGQALTSPDLGDVRGISFWHRGSSSLTFERDSIVVEGYLAYDHSWHELMRQPICTEVGGLTIRYELDQQVIAVRIVFDRESEKGSLAIDDVELWGNRHLCVPATDELAEVRISVLPDQEEADSIMTEPRILAYRVEGLEAGHIYQYSVRALTGLLASTLSNVVSVTTLTEPVIDDDPNIDDSLIETVRTDAAESPAYYSLWGTRISRRPDHYFKMKTAGDRHNYIVF